MTDIGHNSGNIRDRLSQLWSSLIDRCQKLVNTAAEVPEFIDDEETARKAADLIKLMKAAAKEADSTRKQENEPYAAAKQQVDAFFNIPKEAVQQAAQEVERRLAKYLQRKAQREELERRERADRERKEAEDRFNAAVEAEARATEAKQAAALAAVAASAAKADKEGAVARARAARLEAETAASKARAAKAAGDGAAYQDALNEQQLKLAEAKALDEQVAALRKIEREAEERRRTEEKIAREANRDVKINVGEAERSQNMAERLDKKADANQAELSRTRGDLGSVSSLRTDWVHDGFDREKIDLEALRQHLPADAIDQAIRSFIRAGGRTLRGTHIFEQTTAVVR
jgi:hypothetical protein